MVRGSEPVVTLPSPVGELTYNEWHALAMGTVTAIIPALAIMTSFVLYRSDPVAAVVFAAGGMAYASGFTALATAARFVDRVPVLREAWYFLTTHMGLVLAAVVAGLVWIR